MIVTLKQLAAMRAGSATVAFVPLMRCGDWKVGKRVALRRLVVREEQQRTSVPLREREGADQGAQVAIVVTTIGEPQAVETLTLADARRGGFKTVAELHDMRSTVLTSRERRDLVVAVGFDMVGPRTRWLTAKAGTLTTTDYTHSAAGAMIDAGEVLA